MKGDGKVRSGKRAGGDGTTIGGKSSTGSGQI